MTELEQFSGEAGQDSSHEENVPPNGEPPADKPAEEKRPAAGQHSAGGGILKDAGSFPVDEEAARRRAEARRKKREEEERRRIEERRELLKLKQGIIEESELVPQTGYDKPQELHGVKKLENFWYHNKWFIIVGVIAAAFITFLVWQTVTKERNDLYVMVITTNNENQGMTITKRSDIERVLESYCPDFDKNGYVHVALNVIYVPLEGSKNQMNDIDTYKFTSELYTGDSQLWLCDEGVIDLIEQVLSYEDQDLNTVTVTAEDVGFFMDLSEKHPDAAFNEHGGLVLNKTDAAGDLRWNDCPDGFALYVRAEYEGMTGNSAESKRQRERAVEVLLNIIGGEKT